VKIWAELGVIFLMFSLGLEFSFRRLAKVGVSAGVTALVQIATMILLGNLTGRLLGWSAMDAIFLGCMIAISSTTIIIKALEELGLKSRRFAELVFGILIVEDLAAIIMLVALSNIAGQSTVSGLDLVGAGGRLVLVVGAWLVIGIFIVPRLIRTVAKRGNNEMMIVFSLALCLALVSLSAYFHYSVALGAFIMGSIIAETREVHRIEELVGPLKDIFGAVFFVSVGMLLDPAIILSNLGPILAICLVIVLGKILSVGLGTIITGKSLSTAFYAGFSMAQIGEFSFIIATLGLSYGAILPKLYPMIVAASLFTTFTTPFLIKLAPSASNAVKNRLNERTLAALDRYANFLQRRSAGGGLGPDAYLRGLRWLASLILVISIFIFSGLRIYPWFKSHLSSAEWAQSCAWVVGFILSSPFIWAMLMAYSQREGHTDKRPLSFPTALVVSRVLTFLVLGLVSLEFFSVWFVLLLTLAGAGLLLFIFRGPFGAYYRWFEETFVKGMTVDAREPSADGHAHLVPWDAHLAEISVNARFPIVGQSLLELRLREKYGLNVVVIKRGDQNIVAPKPLERIYPADVILCFGTDEALDRFETAMIHSALEPLPTDDLSSYGLRSFEVQSGAKVALTSIRQSGIREDFDCMVVGLERAGERLQSPHSDLVLEIGDVLWIVGDIRQLTKLQTRFQD
ncbi:MAG: cation:proton antiporter, partial [Proteobacteria bacterium]|nr:cation:proton antiporter [Pseudomonadota bacterium]